MSAPDTIRESLFSGPSDPRRRAGAPQILRATVERCRREGKHLGWVDVDDLATILDDLAALRFELQARTDERDSARRAADGWHGDLVRSLTREEQAEAALQAARERIAQLEAALQDELDNWNPERRPTISAQLRTSEAALQDAREALREADDILARLQSIAFPDQDRYELWAAIDKARDAARDVLGEGAREVSEPLAEGSRLESGGSLTSFGDAQGASGGEGS